MFCSPLLLLFAVASAQLSVEEHKWYMRVKADIGCTNETFCPTFNQTSPCPPQTGVTCAAGSVTKISFAGLRGGTLSSAFAQLTALTHLALNDGVNMTVSTDAISSLTNLVFLSLRNMGAVGNISNLWSLTALKDALLAVNQLGGTIGSEVAKLSGLTRLQLFANRLTGPLDALFQLTNLNELLLYSNRFEVSTLSPAIGNLAKLVSLHIGGLGFNGTLPSQVALLTELTSLEAGSNSFQGSLDSLVRLRLKTLNFAGNDLTEIGNLGALTTVQTYGEATVVAHRTFSDLFFFQAGHQRQRVQRSFPQP
jgi:hypothetical protein